MPSRLSEFARFSGGDEPRTIQGGDLLRRRRGDDHRMDRYRFAGREEQKRNPEATSRQDCESA